MGERATVRPIEPPRAAPVIASKLRPMAPQICSGLIEKGNSPRCVCRVNGHGQRFKQFGAIHDATLPPDASMPPGISGSKRCDPELWRIISRTAAPAGPDVTKNWRPMSSLTDGFADVLLQLRFFPI